MGKTIKRKGRRLCYRLVNGRKRLRRCDCGDGGGSCCFCADIEAEQGKPCGVSYIVVNPDGQAVPMTAEQMCIVAKRCCAGSKVRITLRRDGHQESHSDYRPGGVNKFRDETNDITERAVVICTIVRDGDKCSFSMEKVEYYYRLDRTVQDEKGVYDIPPVIRTELLYIDQRFNAALRNPFVMTRPEPLYTVFKGLPLDKAADGEIWGATFTSNENKQEWYWHFWDEKCAGKLEKLEEDLPNNGRRYQDEAWSSESGCLRCVISLANSLTFSDAFSTASRLMGSEASVTMDVLEDDCCPDQPGIKFSAQPFGPVNPADPGNPDGLQYGCPSCGAAFDGVKCRVCSFCQGCGG